MEGLEMQKIAVKLEGLTDIMFDRFIDHSKDIRPPEQKMYLITGNKLVLPSENIESFLFGMKGPPGCALKFEGKEGRNYSSMGLAHVIISPLEIPIMAKGKQVVYKDFKGKQFYVYRSSPKIGSGINVVKSEIKPRPVLRLPWSVSFQLKVIKNNLIDDVRLYNWFVAGGVQIALGTYRPKFGRFAVDVWKTV